MIACCGFHHRTHAPRPADPASLSALRRLDLRARRSRLRRRWQRLLQSSWPAPGGQSGDSRPRPPSAGSPATGGHSAGLPPRVGETLRLRDDFDMKPKRGCSAEFGQGLGMGTTRPAAARRGRGGRPGDDVQRGVRPRGHARGTARAGRGPGRRGRAPLWPVPAAAWPCSNEVYEGADASRRRKNPGRRTFAPFAFGDLFLDDIRAYREQRLAGTGLEPLFPVWGTSEDTPRVGPDDARSGPAGDARFALTRNNSISRFVGRAFDAVWLLEELAEALSDPCGRAGASSGARSATPGRCSIAPSRSGWGRRLSATGSGSRI